MNQEVLARLRRLGVVKGTRNLQAPRASRRSSVPHRRTTRPVTARNAAVEPRPLEVLLPDLRLAQTPVGACYTLERSYPLAYRHGDDRLDALLAHSPSAAAIFCQDERLASLQVDDLLFLDTETTGLGGAGTLAFMVGIAFFEVDTFVVRQYFLRDHGDEPALLLLLQEQLQEKGALVTFNGRSFDVPLLDSRFLLNRMVTDLVDHPHIDLLHPARRLWRRRFQSCALSALEQNVLGLQRTQEDVPGWLIPALYNDYLRNGDGRELLRVFYHNEMDMLSMATLAARILRQFSRPGPDDHPLDLLGLGKWQADLGLVGEAEYCLRLAAVPELPTAMYHQALLRLAYLLKRHDRREEAVPVWQQIACTTFEDVTAHVELAKHFEWYDGDLEQAQLWTERALALVEGLAGAATTRAALEHRLDRLRRKLARCDGSGAA
jgi:uncharacterized protein YprB with RNaseH-like and TPR domain